jgi:hypothetical protein
LYSTEPTWIWVGVTPGAEAPPPEPPVEPVVELEALEELEELLVLLQAAITRTATSAAPIHFFVIEECSLGGLAGGSAGSDR